MGAEVNFGTRPLEQGLGDYTRGVCTLLEALNHLLILGVASKTLRWNWNKCRAVFNGATDAVERSIVRKRELSNGCSGGVYSNDELCDVELYESLEGKREDCSIVAICVTILRLK